MPKSTTPLYCYDGKDGSDPHAVILQLTWDDFHKFQFQRQTEAYEIDTHEFGTYVEVVDQESGDRYNVASAPCGLGCHCAAVAVKL